MPAVDLQAITNYGIAKRTAAQKEAQKERDIFSTFAQPSFAANLYKNSYKEMGNQFNQAVANLNNYYNTATGQVNNSFAQGIQSLNTNYNAAIQRLGDIAAPFKETNLMAQKEYRDFLGLGDQTAQQIQAKLESTPGYKFQFEQGQRALERSQAAKGNLLSGNAAIEAQKLGQGFAQSAYQDRLGNLMNLMGATSPILAQLTGQQAQLQAGLGDATMAARQAQGGILAQLSANQGQNLANVNQAQATTGLQAAQNQAGLLSQYNLGQQQLQTGLLTGQRANQAAIQQAQIGAGATMGAQQMKNQAEENQGRGYLEGIKQQLGIR